LIKFLHYLFYFEFQINTDDLNNLMYAAIIENRTEFIELFIENDFNLKQFLSYRRLLNLYVEVLIFIIIFLKMIYFFI
jgi:hypothetical protein